MRDWIDAATQLNEIAPPTSPAFWNWFRGSKVVDSKGQPLVLYHGTRKGFDQIRGANARHHLAHKLIFASDSPEAASEFAGVRPDYEKVAQKDHEWSGGNVHPIYMRMVKPFQYWLLDPTDVVEAGKGNPESQAAYAFFKNRYYNIRELGEWAHIETNDALSWLKSQGYDGFTAWEGGGMSFACFDEKQIRSVFDTLQEDHEPFAYDREEDDYEPFSIPEHVLKAGTVLFHGTSSPDFDERNEDLSPPFWVSNEKSVAEYFVKWNEFEDAQPRIITYRLNRDLRLAALDKRAMDEIEADYDIEYAGRDDAEEYADFLKRHGFEGWCISGNYGSGDDIMLSRSDCLDYISTEVVGS